jgi:hypothetical protein
MSEYVRPVPNPIRGVLLSVEVVSGVDGVQTIRKEELHTCSALMVVNATSQRADV